MRSSGRERGWGTGAGQGRVGWGVWGCWGRGWGPGLAAARCVRVGGQRGLCGVVSSGGGTRGLSGRACEEGVEGRRGVAGIAAGERRRQWRFGDDSEQPGGSLVALVWGKGREEHGV